MSPRVHLQLAGAEEGIVVTRFPALLGRAPESEVRVDNQKASRRHAALEWRDGRLVLVDLGSQNGVMVNGLRVSMCNLAPGDELTIGTDAIRVLAVHEGERGEASGGRGAPPAERAARRVRRRRLLARLGPAAILLLLSAAAGWWLARDSGPRPAASDPEAARRARALEELAALKRRSSLEERVSRELLSEAAELARSHGELGFAGRFDPFADFLSQLIDRRRLEVDNRYHTLGARCEELLAARRYGEALALAGGEAAELAREEPRLEGAVKRLREETEGRTERALRDLESEAAYLEGIEAREECLERLGQGIELFAGSAWGERLRGALEACRGRFAAAEAERERRAKEGLARLELEEGSRGEAAAETERKSAPAPAALAPLAAPAPPSLSGLFELLRGAIDAGALATKLFNCGELRGSPLRLLEGGKLLLRTASGEEAVPLELVPPSSQLLMARECLSGTSLLKAAYHGYRQGAAKEAGDVLWKYVSEGGDEGDESERNGKAEKLLALSRGLERVPEGGYTYSKTHGWEDAPEKASRTAVEAGSRLAQRLRAASSLKSLEGAFAGLEPLLEDPLLRMEARRDIRSGAIAALSALRERIQREAEKSAKQSGIAALRLARLELDKRRAEALKVIFDLKIYLPEDHPDWQRGDQVNGQAEVDRLISAVRELWENAGKFAVSIQSQNQRRLEMLRRIDESLFPRLRHRPEAAAGGDSLADLFLSVSETMDLKSYALNRAEAELYRYNRKVEEFNRRLQDADLSESDKAHAAFVNDYREMLGLKRTFIDVRLCRATRKHSQACDRAGRIWHDGPDGSPGSRARAEGFPAPVAENVAIGYASPHDIWTRGWYRASDHHRNALGSHWNTMGYGYAGRVGTENFAISTPPFK